MAQVRYRHPKTGETVWGPMPGHGVWNTPHGIHRLHEDYNKDPRYVDAWRQVRQDSLDAVLGKTEGIHASPIRIPANAPHRPPGGHRGEIGDPSDRTNYLDEAYEFEAVNHFLNRTGWYSDENRMARMVDKQNQATAAAAPAPAPVPPAPSLAPTQLDVSGSPAALGGPPTGQGQAGMPWTSGAGPKTAKGIDTGNTLFIGQSRNRHGATGWFGRGGPRLQNQSLTL